MKITYFLHTSTITDGSSKAFLHLIEQIKNKKDDLLVIIPRDGEMYSFLQKINIKCVILRWEARPSVYPSSKTFEQKLLFLPRLIGWLIINNFAIFHAIKIVLKFKPDIIHSNSSVLTTGYFVAKLLKIPHIYHIREYGALDFNYYYFPTKKIQHQRYLKNNSYTICITKAIQHYNSLVGCSTSRVIYDGVLSVKLQKYLDVKKNYFLFVGALQKAKGVLPLIEAYSEYCKKSKDVLPLFIAGTGSKEYICLIIEKIKRFNLEDRVRLLGLQKDILPLYYEATALIVPSLSEGFGFITAEAMFCGCLVIGNDVAGTKEQFDNGKDLTGEDIALRYRTQDELVNHLINVTNNCIKQYESIILRGQRVACDLYSIEQNSKQVYEFYKYILNENK